jgi:hypothetical protein
VKVTHGASVELKCKGIPVVLYLPPYIEELLDECHKSHEASSATWLAGAQEAARRESARPFNE